MNLPPCQMEERDGQMWCLDCQRFHVGHTADIARDPGEKGQKYRAIWRNNRPASARPLLRSLPMAQQCQHNTGKLGIKPCCGGCAYYGCSIKGQVRLPDCTTCHEFQPNHPVADWPASIPVDAVVGYAHQGPKQHLATMKQHIAGGKRIVPLAVLESRKGICQSGVCGKMKRDACDMAGFPLSNERFAWAVSSCPLGLWRAHESLDSGEHDTEPSVPHLPG